MFASGSTERPATYHKGTHAGRRLDTARKFSSVRSWRSIPCFSNGIHDRYDEGSSYATATKYSS
jgi:hypothetical protein